MLIIKYILKYVYACIYTYVIKYIRKRYLLNKTESKNPKVKSIEIVAVKQIPTVDGKVFFFTVLLSLTN